LAPFFAEMCILPMPKTSITRVFLFATYKWIFHFISG
jgi:hypothetical protein